MIDTAEYDLLQPRVFDKLRDIDWFKNAISLEYRATAQEFGCAVVMSRQRLIQAYDIFWNDADGGKVKNLPEGTASLDQFKLSSYLCFWLRRINPIADIRPLATLGSREEWINGEDRLQAEAENFILYGNEMAALILAIKLAQYLSLVAFERKGSSVPAIGSKSGLAIKTIDRDTLIEYGKILKHKNMSAHGLNMALQMFCGIGQTLVHISV